VAPKHPQVREPIVISLTIDVINVMAGPGAMDESPSYPVDVEIHTIQAKLQITVGALRSFNPARVRPYNPSKHAGSRVVG